MNTLNVFRQGYRLKKYFLENFCQFFRNIKYAFQRIKYGFCERDVWDLYSYWCRLIPAQLKYLAENHYAHPYDMSDDQWYNWLYETAYLIEYADPEGKNIKMPYWDLLYDKYLKSGSLGAQTLTKEQQEEKEILYKYHHAEVASIERHCRDNLKKGMKKITDRFYDLWD